MRRSQDSLLGPRHACRCCVFSGDESELTVLDQGSGGRCYGCKGVAGGGHGDCTLTGKAALGKQLSGRADLKFEQKKRTPFPFPWCCR